MNAPAPNLEIPKPAPAPLPAKREEPLLLVDVVPPDEYVHESGALRVLRWTIAAVALLLPGVELVFANGATATAIMWIAMVVAVFGVWFAGRFNWAPAAWFSAACAAGWSFFSVKSVIAMPEGPWPAVFLFVLALAGLWRMRRAPIAGGALFSAMGLAAAYGAYGAGAASPFGVALTAISLSAALAGGTLRKREPALGLGWAFGCVGLWILSGQPAAQPWLTPAFVLFAAIFLAIEALALPVIGRAGLMIAALGAASPLLAIGALYGARIGWGGPDGEALAFTAAAALQAGVLVLCLRRMGDLKALSFAIAPVGAAIVLALIAASAVGLGEDRSAAALALCALGFARLHRNTPHRMWAVASIILLLGALAQAGRAAWFLMHGSSGAGAVGADALVIVLVGAGIPALAAAFAARGEKAPVMQSVFEAFAIGFGWIALIGVVRWIATAGAPATPVIGFAEAGAQASVWLAAGSLLLLCPDLGAQSVRRAAAGGLFALGAAALACASFAWLNPWWGGRPLPATGWPLFNTLALGYLAPAVTLTGVAWLARRRDSQALVIAALSASAACVWLWLALELRRAFHGPDLSVGVLPAENAALAALALAAAIALRASRRYIDATERVCAAALALAIFAKIAFVDVHLPADGWRVGSYVLMALAGVVLGAPRGERPSAKRLPSPAFWNALHHAAAHA